MWKCFFCRCLLSNDFKVPSLSRVLCSTKLGNGSRPSTCSTVPACLPGLNQTPSVSNRSASASVTIFPVLTSHNMEIYSSESSPLATQSPACTE